jgi:hypothetical protein
MHHVSALEPLTFYSGAALRASLALEGELATTMQASVLQYRNTAAAAAARGDTRLILCSMANQLWTYRL